MHIRAGTVRLGTLTAGAASLLLVAGLSPTPATGSPAPGRAAPPARAAHPARTAQPARTAHPARTAQPARTAHPARTAQLARTAHPAREVQPVHPLTTPAAGGSFTALRPTRLLDTRVGTGARAQAIPAHGSVAFAVLGRGGVPSSGVADVVLNVTVNRPGAAGYATAYTTGASRPTTSNVNFRAGQTVANLTVARPSVGGQVSLYNGSSGPVELIADVSGYHRNGAASAAGAFGPVGPARLLDTRTDSGPPVAAGQTVSVTAEGAAGVPATGVSAVVVNVTATRSTAAGYVSAYADGVTPPTTSTVNFAAGATVANLAFVAVGADGKIAVRNGSTGSVHLVVDVFGYIRAGAVGTGAAAQAGAYASVAPVRVLDTRTGTGAAKGAVAAKHGFGVHVLGAHGLPARDVAAVVLNVTVTDAKTAGYVSAYATREARPDTSDVNFGAGATVADLAIVPVGSDGRIALYNGSNGTVDLIADIAGYIVASSPTLGEVPQAGTFDADTVSCASASFCVALGHATGSTARWTAYSGATWSAPADLPALGTLLEVSCPSVGYCIGTDGVHSQTYNGATWSAVSTLPSGFDVGLFDGLLSRLACVSPTFCLKISGPDAARWNGSTWATTSPFPADENALELSCGASTCMTIGDGSPLVYDGSTWTKAARSAVNTDFDNGAKISCAGSTCTVVGDLLDGSNTASTTYNGTSWSTPVVVPEGATAASLSCVSTTWCMTIGGAFGAYGGSTYYSIFNGSSWGALGRAPTVDVAGGGGPISCPTTAFCAMADDGALRTFAGTSWSATSAWPGAPIDVSCASPTACLAVQEYGSALAWNGTTWTQTPHVSGMGDFAAVSCPSAQRCVAVGLNAANQVVATVRDGTVWSAPKSLSMGGDIGVIDGISCSSNSFCVVVGGERFDRTDEFTQTPVLVSRFNGSSWSAATELTGLVDARSVSCTSSTFCAAAAYRPGEIAQSAPLTFNGSSWKAFAPPYSNAGAGQVACAPGTTTCLLPKSDGTMFVHIGTGSSWTTGFGPALGSTDQLTALSCVSTHYCVASGAIGTTPVTWTYDGAGWSVPSTVPVDGDDAGSISCPTTSFCAVIG